MLDCKDISRAMAEYDECEVTDRGTRFATQCMYPSFERVSVFVVSLGGEYIVHDGGGAVRTAWVHGRDRRALNRTFSGVAESFGCDFHSDQFRVTLPNADWVFGGVATVANASADAARAVVGKSRIPREQVIIRKTKHVFDTAKWKPKTELEHVEVGDSGKRHTFDLAVFHKNSSALIDAVVPHANSIAAKYLAFSDAGNRPGVYKYAVYDGDLSSEDKSLISNVADLVQLRSILGTDGRQLLEKNAA